MPRTAGSLSPGGWQHEHLPTSPSAAIPHLGKKFGNRINVEEMSRCCSGQYSHEQPTIPVSIPVARTDNDRHMGGQILALPGRLACNACDSGERAGPVAPTLRLAVKRDAARTSTTSPQTATGWIQGVPRRDRQEQSILAQGLATDFDLLGVWDSTA